MSASELYDTDFVLWTEQQAAALRRLPAASNSLDIEHLAAEIEDLGKCDVREVESLLRLMLIHGLKVAFSPNSSYVPHWRSEIVAFQESARMAFTRSTRQMIDLGSHWKSAIRVTAAERPKPVRLQMIAAAETTVFPLDIGGMLSSSFDVDAFIEHVSVVSKGIQPTP